MSNSTSLTVGIVGATGAAGQELLRLLHERNFPMASLRLFASARSVGKIIEVAGKNTRSKRRSLVCSATWTWRFSPRKARSRKRWRRMR